MAEDEIIDALERVAEVLNHDERQVSRLLDSGLNKDAARCGRGSIHHAENAINTLLLELKGAL